MTQPQIAPRANLARRMKRERARAGMSLARLSDELTAAGWRIDKGALSRIENEKDNRSLPVESIVALSTVFGLSPTDLLTPVELVNEAEAQELLVAAVSGMTAVYEASAELARVVRKLAHRTGGSDEDAVLAEAVQRLLEYRAPAGAAGDGPEERLAQWMREAIELLQAGAWQMGLAQLDAVNSRRQGGVYVIERGASGFTYTQQSTPAGKPPVGVLVVDAECLRKLTY